MIRWRDGKITNEGCVIGLWEHNGPWDSDFYARVIDPEKGTIEDIEYDSTCYAPSGNYAEVDLTKENYAKYLKNSFNNQLKAFLKKDIRQSNEIQIGRIVKVVKGRKVPIGTEGKVFYRKEVNYDPYGREWGKNVKIGIRDDEGNTYWTYEHNVKVSNNGLYRTPIKQLIKQLKEKRSKSFLNCKESYGWN